MLLVRPPWSHQQCMQWDTVYPSSTTPAPRVSRVPDLIPEKSVKSAGPGTRMKSAGPGTRNNRLVNAAPPEAVAPLEALLPLAPYLVDVRLDKAVQRRRLGAARAV